MGQLWVHLSNEDRNKICETVGKHSKTDVLEQFSLLVRFTYSLRHPKQPASLSPPKTDEEARRPPTVQRPRPQPPTSEAAKVKNDIGRGLNEPQRNDRLDVLAIRQQNDTQQTPAHPAGSVLKASDTAERHNPKLFGSEFLVTQWAPVNQIEEAAFASRATEGAPKPDPAVCDKPGIGTTPRTTTSIVQPTCTVPAMSSRPLPFPGAVSSCAGSHVSDAQKAVSMLNFSKYSVSSQNGFRPPLVNGRPVPRYPFPRPRRRLISASSVPTSGSSTTPTTTPSSNKPTTVEPKSANDKPQLANETPRASVDFSAPAYKITHFDPVSTQAPGSNISAISSAAASSAVTPSTSHPDKQSSTATSSGGPAISKTPSSVTPSTAQPPAGSKAAPFKAGQRLVTEQKETTTARPGCGGKTPSATEGGNPFHRLAAAKETTRSAQGSPEPVLSWTTMGIGSPVAVDRRKSSGSGNIGLKPGQIDGSSKIANAADRRRSGNDSIVSPTGLFEVNPGTSAVPYEPTCLRDEREIPGCLLLYHHVLFQEPYRTFSPEELRMEDYRRGHRTCNGMADDKGSLYSNRKPATTSGAATAARTSLKPEGNTTRAVPPFGKPTGSSS